MKKFLRIIFGKNSLDSTITNLNEARVSHYFLLCTTNAWNCLNRIACVLLCLPTASVTWAHALPLRTWTRKTNCCYTHLNFFWIWLCFPMQCIGITTRPKISIMFQLEECLETTTKNVSKWRYSPIKTPLCLASRQLYGNYSKEMSSFSTFLLWFSGPFKVCQQF